MIQQLVLDTAVLAGAILMENGSETSRAETTMKLICTAGGYEDCEIIALATGIFVSLPQNQGTQIKRINKKGTDLFMINGVNTISRNIVEKKLTFEEAYRELEKLKIDGAKQSKLLLCIFSALACSAFSLLYGGTPADGAISLVSGFLLQLIISELNKLGVHSFTVSFIGSALISAIAVTGFTFLPLYCSVEKIILGCIIPLLPGIAMNNAIRDNIMGDMISGTTKLTDVILTAVGIGAGCGAVFLIYIGLGGVI